MAMKCCETDRDAAQWSEIQFRCRCRFLSSVPLLLLLLLSTVPTTTAADEDGFQYVNTTRLAAFADDFRGGWPTARQGEFKIHLRTADPSLLSDEDKTVCGYAFTARTVDSVTVVARGHLPAPATFRCDGRDEYRVHVGGSDASSYEHVVDSGARVRTVELETNGMRARPIASLCFGFVGGGGGGNGGVRAFCADVGLLTACLRLQANSDANTDFGTNSVQLTAERSYSCRRVVFRDVDVLLGGFHSLVRNRDDFAARRAICDQVEFVRTEANVLQGCVGESTIPYHDTDPVEFEFTGPNRLVDVNRVYKKCDLFNTPQTASSAGLALNLTHGPPYVTFLLVLIFLT